MIGTPRVATAAKPQSKSLEDKYYARNIPKRPKRATSSRRRNHLCIVTGADGLPRRRIAKADNMDDIANVLSRVVNSDSSRLHDLEFAAGGPLLNSARNRPRQTRGLAGGNPRSPAALIRAAGRSADPGDLAGRAGVARRGRAGCGGQCLAAPARCAPGK